MARPKVLLLGPIEHKPARDDFQSLSSIADLIEPRARNRAEFFDECRSGRLDGVVAVYRTVASAAVTGRFDAELAGALPAGLRFVCHTGAGYDQIDVGAMSARGIHVSNVPTAVDDATADAAAFLILSALRNFAASQAALRRGEWRGRAPLALGHDPAGRVLGILGMGGIGRNLARKMRAFGMRVRYHNRTRLAPAAEEGAEYVGFDELLRTSDVLSLNLPLNPSTRHIISGPQLELMKPTAVLVNTARGAVVDEAALVEALARGRIASVGLDVFEHEPEIHPGLVGDERVTLLPHMGTWTVETQTAMERWNVSNVRMALEEGRLRSRVGEQEGMSYET